MSSSPPSELSPELYENPRTWRFTWECQSHIPTVKLYLFKPNFNHFTDSTNLKVDLIVEQSLLVISFVHVEAEMETTLRVPLPSKALIDPEAPVNFRAHVDHIEVKLVLLLPIDHPLVSEIDSLSDDCRPLSAASDLKELSAFDEVCFYCRSCSTKLTRPLRTFKEVPSVNWQDAADNWFGNCCCTFGGISEKLVTGYVKSYKCSSGVCLLDTTSVILSKDDLLECDFSSWNETVDSTQKLNLADDSSLTPASRDSEIKQGQQSCVENGASGGQVADRKYSSVCLNGDTLKTNPEHDDSKISIDDHSPCCLPSPSEVDKNVEKPLFSDTDTKHELSNGAAGCSHLHLSQAYSNEQQPARGDELLAHQKVLLNGFLESGFMARSSSLSKDVRWVEFSCHQCSSLLGAYPCFDEHAPLDGGVRLFKCQISTCLPSLESNDLFRCYSLDRMFALQLVESAKEELSFRTVVRDWQTGHPMLQLVLLNPDSWCYSGSCLISKGSASRVDMYPAVKVLFSSCCNDKDVFSREVEEWMAKNEVEEMYMLPSLTKKLVTSLESENSVYPPALQKTMHGLLLSSIRR